MKRIVGFIGLLVLALLFASPSMALAAEKQKHVLDPNREVKDFAGTAQRGAQKLPADLENKLLTVANRQFKFKVDKIYFLNESWKEAREVNFPNRVTMRTRFGYLLTQQDGQWVRTVWILQQMSDLKGGWTDTYHFVAGGAPDYNPYLVKNYDPSLVKNTYKP